MSKTPPFLTKGSKVHLVATARKVEQSLLDKSVEILAKQGFEAVYSPRIKEAEYQFAGNDATRVADFQSAIDHGESQAVLCMRGGYGTQRILDSIDFSGFVSRPKWLVGFSDVTAIHSHVNKLGVPSIHGPMPSTYSNTESLCLTALFDVLRGKSADVRFNTHPLDILGNAEGELVGGNLSILHTQMCTPGASTFDGKILFIEDIDEMLYHIDRMLVHMKRARLFDRLRGVLVGGFSDMRDNTLAHGFKSDNPFGKTALEIVSEHFSGMNIPVAMSFPAGHIHENTPIILGSTVNLRVTAQENSLTYS
jgi:muramoyltetrapeptide carboxypeptidase